jgi:hypothetical protein
MELYDTAATSMDVERIILQRLKYMHRDPHHAKEEVLEGENVYKVTINVEEMEG